MVEEKSYLGLLERRNRLLLGTNLILMVFVLATALFGRWPSEAINAQEREAPKSLTVSELSVVDAKGTVRVRIGGQLPDAIVDGKVHPRGDSASGVILYDDTGEERSGYLTFGSGNVGVTLDNRDGQTAEFLAGPKAGSVMRLHWRDDAVELRTDEDGPSVHILQGKRVVFHEPPVAHPETTELCKALREARSKATKEQLLDACRSRSSEAACEACFAK